MNALKNGNNTSEVKMINSKGFVLKINDKEYFLSFDNYPYFRDIPVQDIFNVTIDEYRDLRWEKYDIDLCEEILNNPLEYPVKMKILNASEMGRKGGSSKSKAKRIASRLNGRKGGRPAKKREKVLI